MILLADSDGGQKAVLANVLKKPLEGAVGTPVY